MVSEAVEASLQLGAKVLRLTGAPAERIEESLDAFRRDDYALLDSLLEERAGAEPARPGPAGSWLARHMPAIRRRGKGTR